MSKTIQMPLPGEAAGGQPVKVTEKLPSYVQDTVYNAFGKLFSQTDWVKCIMIKTNGVLNLQFIGNGCVANMQIYEVTSKDALEEYIPHVPVRKHMKRVTEKGGAS